MPTMWEIIEDALLENRDLFSEREVDLRIIDGGSDQNKKACVRLINEILGVDSTDINQTDGVTQDRAVHSMITFLLGMKIGEFTNLMDTIHFAGQRAYGISGPRLWMMTALAHDYGYNSKDIYKENYDLSLALRDGNLLNDLYGGPFTCLDQYSVYHPVFITHDYQTILNYFLYKQKCYGPRIKAAHPEWTIEFSDHGIVGGCKLFQKYSRKCKRIIEQGKGELLADDVHFMYKTACMMAAQHNIFKSPDKDSDPDYQKYDLNTLLSDEAPPVTEANPLLLLLSLVDTIECTKRFSQSSNPSHYFQSRTVLENILIEINETEIILDYSPLLKKAVSRDSEEEDGNSFVSRLDRARNAVKTFGEWTSCTADTVDGNEYKVRVVLKK